MKSEKKTCLDCHFLVWYLGVSKEHIAEVTNTERNVLKNRSCYEILKLQECPIGCAYSIWEPEDFKILKGGSAGAHANLDDKIDRFKEILNIDRASCDYWKKYDYLISIGGCKLLKEKELRDEQAAIERKFHQQESERDRRILGATLLVLTVATLTNIFSNLLKDGIPISFWVMSVVLFSFVLYQILKK